MEKFDYLSNERLEFCCAGIIKDVGRFHHQKSFVCDANNLFSTHSFLVFSSDLFESVFHGLLRRDLEFLILLEWQDASWICISCI